MAYAMTKRGSLDNCVTYEFICDTVADMNAIEDRYRTIGSTAVVLQGDAGLEVYISGSDKIWTSLSVINSGSVPSGGGLSFHICGQDELDANGLPDVSEPDEVTFYLVPAADETTGNIYDEYIYVDDEWERFGSGAPNIDLSAYAPKANPAFTGSVSLDRYTGSTVGELSVSLGRQTKATGDFSFAEGNYTTASGSGSHAEGQSSIASGSNSHAEGLQTKARGDYSHAEGQHTSGTSTTTYNNTTYYYGASGASSHSEGRNTIAHGSCSHAEGDSTKALDAGAHAEGAGTTASGTQSHAEGAGTTASGALSHAEGAGTTASGLQGHAEGSGTIASGNISHAEGSSTKATGNMSHAEGVMASATGDTSHAEGTTTTASGTDSHAEGLSSLAYGFASHAEGNGTKATGTVSHAEGLLTIAAGMESHAEGVGSFANGDHSHAEGSGSEAIGDDSHAEGYTTYAYGIASHTEGQSTKAIGSYEHVSGLFNVVDSAPAWVASTSYEVGDLVSVNVSYTNQNNQAATYTRICECKVANSDSTFTYSNWNIKGIYAEIIGNGTADNARSNARALDWNGNEYLKGDLYVGCNADSTGGSKVATEAYVTTTVANASSVDTSTLAPKANPEFTGSVSLGRKANTTIGTNSIAIGNKVTASGNESSAIGSFSTAEGDYACACGYNAKASGDYSHAEGFSTTAVSAYTHAEGRDTIASGLYTHVGGRYNVDNIFDFPEWQANTSYIEGDLVKITTNENDTITVVAYRCKTPNNDAEFTRSNWTSYGIKKFAEIIGNGFQDARSNARALDWDGNEYLMGDLYINCNTDSTGGKSIGARISALEAEITSLRLALIALQTDNEVILENGQLLSDEQGNLIEYDTPTT